MAVAVGTARAARSHRVGASEERAFRCVNDAPDGLRFPVWPVMQVGSLGAVFVTAAEVARRGRPRAALVTATSGAAVWAGVRAVKPYVGRGRPERYLPEVNVRGRRQTGLGYPSGHAAVALTLACVVPADRVAARVPLVGLAGVVGVARMYVGAHLPLDVAGGWAIGAAAACTVSGLARAVEAVTAA